MKIIEYKAIFYVNDPRIDFIIRIEKKFDSWRSKIGKELTFLIDELLSGRLSYNICFVNEQICVAQSGKYSILEVVK
jgi:hypothetical protein